MSALFSTFYLVPVAADIPTALGPDTLIFNSIILTGQPSDGVSNVTDVFVDLSAIGGGKIHLGAGLSVTITAPLNSFYNASQFYITSVSAGDGVLAFWTKAEWKTFNSVETKLERAAVALVKTISTTIDDCSVTSGLSDEQLDTDSIHFFAEGGPELVKNSALWNLHCMLKVRTRAKSENGLELHRARTAYVRDLFMDSQLVYLLASQEQNLFCQPESVVNRSIRSSIDSDSKHYVSTLEFDISCAGNQLT